MTTPDMQIPEAAVCVANAAYDSVIARGGTTIEAMNEALQAAFAEALVPAMYQLRRHDIADTSWVEVSKFNSDFYSLLPFHEARTLYTIKETP